MHDHNTNFLKIKKKSNFFENLKISVKFQQKTYIYTYIINLRKNCRWSETDGNLGSHILSMIKTPSFSTIKNFKTLENVQKP